MHAIRHSESAKLDRLVFTIEAWVSGGRAQLSSMKLSKKPVHSHLEAAHLTCCGGLFGLTPSP
jgi:hypothetical protein